MEERPHNEEQTLPEQTMLSTCEGCFQEAYSLPGFNHMAILETAWGTAECITLNPIDLLPNSENCRFAINRRSVGSYESSIVNGDECIDIEFIIMETLLKSDDIRLVEELSHQDILNSFLYFVTQEGKTYDYPSLRKLTDSEMVHLAARLKNTRISENLPDWVKTNNRLGQT